MNKVLVSHLLVCLVMFGSLGAPPALAEPSIRPDPIAVQGKGKRTELFQGMLFTSKEGDELPFMMLEPESTTEKAPLVVYLHGPSGERGGGKQIESYIRDLASKRSRERLPCYIIAPQCVGPWTALPMDEVAASAMPGEPNSTMSQTLELVDAFIKSKKVDSERVYLIGVDKGGAGVLEAAARRPGLFAGVIASAPDMYDDREFEKKLATVPIALVVESATNSTAHDRMEAIAKKLRAAGNKNLKTMESDGKEKGRTPAIDWLFRQKGQAAAAPAKPGERKTRDQGSRTTRDQSGFQRFKFEPPQGVALQYRLMEPAPAKDAGERWPLVLVLHGGGSKGDDNERQLECVSASFFKTSKYAEKYACYVVAPQCPSDQSWIGTKWEKLNDRPMPPDGSLALQSAVELVEHLKRTHPIDPDRIYVIGYSMGGFGALEAAIRWPDRIAGIIAGGAETYHGECATLSDTPILMIHGRQDELVPIDHARRTASLIQQAGGDIRLEEYDGRHLMPLAVWNNTAHYDWLFAKRLRSQP